MESSEPKTITELIFETHELAEYISDDECANDSSTIASSSSDGSTSDSSSDNEPLESESESERNTSNAQSSGLRSANCEAPKYALISLYDKSGIDALAQFLVAQNYQILSTGGTYEYLKSVVSEKNLTQVADLTGYPSILEGRVKTLHPKIFGGILANRKRKHDQIELEQYQIPVIDIVVVNLYPFHLASIDNPLEATELIDIGGVSLLRAAAKNCDRVTVLSQPSDYQYFINIYPALDTIERQKFATQTFRLTSAYDRAIADYFTAPANRPIIREYFPQIDLKYGCNPHQTQAKIYTIGSGGSGSGSSCSNSSSNSNKSPLKVLNGRPGYINIMDALNGWGLVNEADQELNRAVVASFKHTSPAGVGCSRQLSVAFTKARQADPKSSFGDFIALSRICNLETAMLIKVEVSDGIIAPDYEPEALEILKAKKGGEYLILQMTKTDERPITENLFGSSSGQAPVEFREMSGLVLSQTQNTARVTRKDLAKYNLSYNVVTDLLLANIILKYAQSNNIVMVKNGQAIGVAAGQQSRIDAVRLAGQKAGRWFLRKHPRVASLNHWFSPGLSRTEKINLIEDFIDATEPLDPKYFLNTVRPAMEPEYKQAVLRCMKGVSMASDAFFPFRDNIDEAAKYGVEYIIQPGGSRNDQEIIEACDEHHIRMVMTGLRMFTH